MSIENFNVAESQLWREQPTLPRHIHVEGSLFKWIEETDDPQFDQIRRRIQSLWWRIPETKRSEYSARLRSKRRSDFFSAYNELWYHQALEIGGLSCSLSEATLNGTLPDLLLSVGQSPIAIAECYLRMQPENTVRDDSEQNRWFHATRQKMKNKRIRLHVHDIVHGKDSPSAPRLAAYLDKLVLRSLVEKAEGAFNNQGRYQYVDSKTGWSLDFTLMVRVSPELDAQAQLLYVKSSEAAWCQGAQHFEEAISRKSRQHSSATLPIVICMAWNYFEHEPDFDEVIRVAAAASPSLANRGVHGIFWTREVYPWNATPAPPCLLHWESPEIVPLLDNWKGSLIGVNERVVH